MPGHPKLYYIEKRFAYEPRNVKRIFVLESPPASSKYFYDVNGNISEPLYKAMMIAFGISANTKAEGLGEFAKLGNILIDATYTPVNKMKGKERKETILKDYPNLKKELEEHGKRKETEIIIVKATLYDLLYAQLIKDGFNVVNKNVRIPFPSNGNQKRFQKEIKTVLFAKL